MKLSKPGSNTQTDSHTLRTLAVLTEDRHSSPLEKRHISEEKYYAGYLGMQ